MYLSLITFILNLSIAQASAQAVSRIEFIDRDSRNALNKLYEDSNLVDSGNLGYALGHRWSCNLYGIRSGMQKMEGARLYELTRKKNTFLNAGSSPTKLFQMDPSAGLVGQSERIKESLRLTPSGMLIAKMTLVNFPDDPIAFAKCVKSL